MDALVNQYHHLAWHQGVITWLNLVIRIKYVYKFVAEQYIIYSSVGLATDEGKWQA